MASIEPADGVGVSGESSNQGASGPVKSFWLRYGGWWVVVLVVVLGRLWGLADYSLDWDECNELAMAKLPVLDLIRVIYSRDIHPPAAHLLTHVWVGLVGDTDLNVRLLYTVYGLLGLWGTYLLARLAKAPCRVSVYTLLLGVFCPFVWHYTHLATHHAFFYATAVFSWVFFLRLLRQERLSVRSPDYWAYALLSVLCLYAQSIAPFLLLSQAVFLVWRHPQQLRRHPQLWAGLAVGFALCDAPQLWAISQPWHPSKMKEMGAGVHDAPSWGGLFFMPAQLLWMGDDKAFQPLIPRWDRLLFYGGVGTFLLYYGFRSLKNKLPESIPLLICITGVPVLLLFAASLLLGLHVLHGRAILYVAFPVLLAMAVWIDAIETRQGKLSAWLLLFAIMAAQAWADFTFIELPANKQQADFRKIVQEIRPLQRPGDGFLISPGYMGLGIMRYLDPARFGLTPSEVQMDPRRTNLFHLVQRIEGPYFFVSGEDVRQRPDVQRAFRVFQQTHSRIWYMGDVKDYDTQLDCRNTFVVKGADKRYWQVHCLSFGSQPCRAPLTGPDANQWQCNADLPAQPQAATTVPVQAP